jgi:hypothetical protein
MADRPGPLEALKITPAMILAGVRAYQAWDYSKKEIEVAAIFANMMKALSRAR